MLFGLTGTHVYFKRGWQLKLYRFEMIDSGQVCELFFEINFMTKLDDSSRLGYRTLGLHVDAMHDKFDSVFYFRAVV